MTIYYVSRDNGKPENDGLTPETPKGFIGDLISIPDVPAVAGDVIRIMKGPSDDISLRRWTESRIIKNPWGDGPYIPLDHPDRPLGQINGRRLPNGEWEWAELM